MPELAMFDRQFGSLPNQRLHLSERKECFAYIPEYLDKGFVASQPRGWQDKFYSDTAIGHIETFGEGYLRPVRESALAIYIPGDYGGYFKVQPEWMEHAEKYLGDLCPRATWRHIVPVCHYISDEKGKVQRVAPSSQVVLASGTKVPFGYAVKLCSLTEKQLTALCEQLEKFYRNSPDFVGYTIQRKFSSKAVFIAQKRCLWRSIGPEFMLHILKSGRQALKFGQSRVAQTISFSDFCDRLKIPQPKAISMPQLSSQGPGEASSHRSFCKGTF